MVLAFLLLQAALLWCCGALALLSLAETENTGVGGRAAETGRGLATVVVEQQDGVVLHAAQ